MKYCRKCGMLLEDTHENCIRCGADVTLEENVSMYPIEVMETIEEENQRKKASGKIVAMIIALVVVLVGLILFFVHGLGTGMITMPTPSEDGDLFSDEDEEFIEEEDGEFEIADDMEADVTDDAAAAEPLEEAAPVNRTVSDENGKYFDYVTEKDDGGNVVFTALVPEDLTEREFYKDYEVYSDRYPFAMNYTATTADNDVRFTYLSPRKLWYKVSETGKSRSDERDLTNFMTYFKYEGARSYLEPLLKQSYPGAKFEMVEEHDVSPAAVEKLEALAKAKNEELFGAIGDYAHIGENTTYANMDYEFSAKVYKYEITLSDKNLLFCKYYVPSLANNLTYANSDTNDRGTVTEWYNFAIVCFETGNEDQFDDYEEAFDLFVENALPTDLFMYVNECYSADIKKAIESMEEPAPLDGALLSKYGGEYSEGTSLDDFDKGVLDMLRASGAVCFKGEDAAVYTPDSFKVAFLDTEKGKVYISGDENEYPGDTFKELVKE